MPGAPVDSEARLGANGELQGDRHSMLIDLDGIDLSQRLLTREQVQEWIPHRGVMQFLDSVVWVDEAKTRAVGHRAVRDDEFWVDGHFPERAMFPGVLMVETGAQLALYLFNQRLGSPQLPAFLRIEDCAFRHHVEPGNDFYVLCREVKIGKRRFISDIQGVVDRKIAFQARITGMSLGEWRGDI